MDLNPTTFRWDSAQKVLWAGVRSYPATWRSASAMDHIPADSDFLARHPKFRMKTRQATVWFENQWCLSTIWGDATYSSNRTDYLNTNPPFIEEPTLVEVGVLMPEPIEHPAVEIDLPTGRVEFPGRSSRLWGDPLAWVSVPEYHRVADLVMHLPTYIDLPEGEWDDAQGFCDLLITAGLERTL